MTHPLSRLLALFVILMSIIACSDYGISDPQGGSIHTTPPPTYTITYDTQPETLPEITLNGFQIASFFVASETSATADGVDLAGFLIEGSNLIQVAPPLGPQLGFIYDTQGPEIIVLEANHGASTTINGLAIDAVGVSSLYVNGIDTSVETDGSFTADVATTNIYTFDAVDTLNHDSSTEYADYNLLYNPSLRARVNQSGINFVASQLIDVVNGLDINALVAGVNPLYSATWDGLFGETYGPDGYLEDVSMTADEINLNLGNGGNIGLDGVITNIHVGLRLRWQNGFLPTTVINVGATASSIDISGNVGVGVNNHVASIAVNNLGLNINNISMDGVPSLFDPIVNPILTAIVGLFDGLIADAIEGAIDGALPGLLDGLIAADYNWVLSGRELGMTLLLEELTTSNNSLLVGLSGGVVPLSINPLIPQPLGPMHTSDTVPEPIANSGDFSVAVNTNVINQTLLSAYYVGITHSMSIGDTTIANLPRDDSLGEDGDSRTLIDPVTAPYIHLTEINGESSTTLAIHGLQITSQTKKNGVWENDFYAQLNASVEISIAVNPDNSLDITFVSTPVVKITKTVLGVGIQLSGGIIDGIVQGSVPGVMENLSASLSGIEIPAFEGFSFTANSFHALGENHTHAGMSGSLSATP